MTIDSESAYTMLGLALGGGVGLCLQWLRVRRLERGGTQDHTPPPSKGAN